MSVDPEPPTFIPWPEQIKKWEEYWEENTPKWPSNFTLINLKP